jgi:outer membrane biosynthesis protein TonB
MFMQNTSMKRSAVLVAGALSLAGAFFAGAAYAADPKLDLASDLITKAVAELKAAQNPDPKREFGGHRMAAIELLTRAQGEIIKAKQFADAPPKEPKPKPPTDPSPKPPTDPSPKPPTDPSPKPPTNPSPKPPTNPSPKP